MFSGKLLLKKKKTKNTPNQLTDKMRWIIMPQWSAIFHINDQQIRNFLANADNLLCESGFCFNG